MWNKWEQWLDKKLKQQGLFTFVYIIVGFGLFIFVANKLLGVVYNIIF